MRFYVEPTRPNLPPRSVYRMFYKVFDAQALAPNGWIATFGDEQDANTYAEMRNNGFNEHELSRHCLQLIGDKGRAEDAAKEARADAEKIREALRLTNIELDAMRAQYVLARNRASDIGKVWTEVCLERDKLKTELGTVADTQRLAKELAHTRADLAHCRALARVALVARDANYDFAYTREDVRGILERISYYGSGIQEPKVTEPTGTLSRIKEGISQVLYLEMPLGCEGTVHASTEGRITVITVVLQG